MAAVVVTDRDLNVSENRLIWAVLAPRLPAFSATHNVCHLYTAYVAIYARLS